MHQRDCQRFANDRIAAQLWLNSNKGTKCENCTIYKGVPKNAGVFRPGVSQETVCGEAEEVNPAAAS